MEIWYVVTNKLFDLNGFLDESLHKPNHMFLTGLVTTW